MFKLNEYFTRSIKYVKRYQKHYVTYAVFGVCFGTGVYLLKDSQYQAVRLGLAGALAQFTTEFIYHPIDTINTKTKAEIHSENLNAYKMIRRIAEKEGFIGYWRGASATYYGSLMGGVIYFSLYKYLKIFFKKFEDPNSDKISVFVYLSSSLVSELLFIFFYYPFDLIRTRMQTRIPQFAYKGPVDGFRNILANPRFRWRNCRELYTGATPSIVLNMANTCIAFTVLESMRDYFKKKYGYKTVNDLSTKHYLLCSVAAGVISGAATNVLEVVTIHKQILGKEFKLIKFFQEQGLKPFTSGLFARITINTLGTVTLFYMVDYFSSIFNVEL